MFQCLTQFSAADFVISDDQIFTTVQKIFTLNFKTSIFLHPAAVSLQSASAGPQWGLGSVCSLLYEHTEALTFDPFIVSCW